MMNVFKYPHVYIVLLTWLVTITLIPIIIHLSRKLGALDKPGGHKTHTVPVSFLGGVAVYIAFAIGAIIPKEFGDIHSFQDLIAYIARDGNRQLFGIVVSGTIVFLLGLIDDYKHLNAIFKLVAIFATTLLLNYFDIQLTLFQYTWLNILMTVFWIAGVTSACNSLDHIDGATAGTSAISAFFIFMIAWYDPDDPQRWLSFVSASVLGATLGFLLYNFNPAKIYLGDNGAFFLGYTLAAMAILGNWDEDPIKAFLMPGLLMMAPIYDIVLSTILRYKNGVVRSFPEAILYCGKDHTTHRMMAHGLSKNVSVYVLYGINIMGGMISLIGMFLETPGFVALVVLYFIGLLLFGKWLDECPKSKLYGPEEAETPQES